MLPLLGSAPVARARLVAGLLLAVLLAACGAPAASTGPQTSAAAASSAASEAASAAASTAPESAAALRIAYASDFDPADMADHLGLDAFREAGGRELAVTQLTEDSAVVAGLIRGDVDIGNIDLTAAIKASQVGVPLRVVMPANMVVEFVLVGQPGIKTVQDLKGKKVAFHAPGSGTEILPRMLVEQADGIAYEDVEWIVLPESPNRAAAMEANRIDVTALEFADVLTLKEGGKPYEIIASFYDVAPEAIASTWVTTADFAAANQDLLVQFGTAMEQGYQQAYDSKESWLAKAKQLLPDLPESRLSETYDFYRSVNMFPKAPFYTQEIWDKMNEFYISAAEYEDPAPFELVTTDVLAAVTSK